MSLQSAYDGERPSSQQTEEGNQLVRRGDEDYVMLSPYDKQTHHNTDPDRDTAAESAGTDHGHVL